MSVDDILLKQPETDYIFTTAGGFLFGNNTSENLYEPAAILP